MERKGGSERDLVMQSSLSYKTPPMKLPLAPIVSTSSDRRGNATVSTRRGSAIFSPTQTLDQHSRPPLQHHRQPPLQQPLVYKDPTTPDPDPDPAPAVIPSSHGASNSRATPPSPPQPQATTPDLPSPAAVAEQGFNDISSIKYRECLKNHAASIGGHVVDGCGEFMSSGEDGTPEALRCAACDCHRNFHRKEVKGQLPLTQIHPYNPNSSNNNIHRNPLLRDQEPHYQQKYHKTYHSQGGVTPPIITFGGNGGDAAAESSSEDLNMLESSGGGHAVIQPSISGSKKRFRTKFSQEQKDRMQEFAAKLDWRIQKQEDEELQRFCSEVGVKRQVFKVWMHNNKQAMKRKQII